VDHRNETMKRLMSRRTLFQQAGKVLFGLSVLTLGSCMPRQPSRYEVKILVTQSRSHFNPATLVIPQGATVVWQNQAIYPQTVTFDPGKLAAQTETKIAKEIQPWDSGILYPGQTFSYTFQTAGDYPYFSRFSEDPYLLGVVTVKA
jgi:plastocyanin